MPCIGGPSPNSPRLNCSVKLVVPTNLLALLVVLGSSVVGIDSAVRLPVGWRWIAFDRRITL
jgi:hypothetical protein